jgi:hypothetical protein
VYHYDRERDKDERRVGRIAAGRVDRWQAETVRRQFAPGS